MISDPRTTPDSRAGRILFAGLVALGAGTITFVLYRTNGLLISLALAAPLVPVIDLLLPGKRHAWRPQPFASRSGGVDMQRATVPAAVLLGLLGLFLTAGSAHAFCGFYVAKADTQLFNKASPGRPGARRRSHRAHHGQRLQGGFARVCDRDPRPHTLARGQIHVADKGLIDHLDAYSAPRLAEVYDPDPCPESSPRPSRRCRYGTGVRPRSVGGLLARARSPPARPARTAIPSYRSPPRRALRTGVRIVDLGSRGAE